MSLGRKRAAVKNDRSVSRSIRRRSKIRAAAESLECRRLLTVTHWINPSGGDFDTPGNWDNGVPTPGVDAVINTPVSAPVTKSVASVDTFASLTSSQPVVLLLGGTLDITGAAQFSSTLTLNGGTVKDATLSTTGAGSIVANVYGRLDGVTLASNVTLSLGSLHIYDGLTLNNATITINFNNALDFYGTQALGGTGTVTFAGVTPALASILLFEQPGPAAMLTIGSNITVNGGGGGFSTGTVNDPNAEFINEGVISANVTGEGIGFLYGILQNQGTLSAVNGGTLGADDLVGHVGSGVLSASGQGSALLLDAGSATPFTIDAGVSITAGADLEFYGNWSNASGSTISVSGGGIGSLNGGLPGNLLLYGYSNGTWSNAGTISVSGSTLILGGTFTLSGLGALSAAGSTVQLVGTLDGQGGTLSLGGTTGNWTLIPSGTIENATIIYPSASPLIVQGGSLSGDTLDSNLTVPGGDTLNIFNGLTLNNATVTLNTAGNLTSTLEFQDQGTLTLGGTGQILFAGTPNSQGAQALFVATGGVLVIGPSIAIHGGLGAVRSLTSQIYNEGTIAADVGGEGISLSGSFDNKGTVEAAPGTITIASGPAFIADTGTLIVGIGGYTPGVTYGQITAGGGPLVLSGTLTAILLNAFVPAPNDAFTVLQFGSQTGSFSTLNLSPSGVNFSESVNANNIVLTATGRTIFGNTAPTPPQQNVNDPSIPGQGGVELGLKFNSDVAGTVSALRFYKSSLDSGTHTGELWTSTGTLLATATFANESANGWQTVNLSSPVTLSPNTVYIVSYHTTSPYIAYTPGVLASGGVNSGPLHVLQNGISGGDGVYAYGPSSFPANYNGQAPIYWVDVVFAPAATSSPSNILGNNAPDASVQNVYDSGIASNGGVELGAKFSSDVAGTASGIRFYKSSLDTGTQTGELWDNAGNLLATANFTGESASGWQQVTFSSPVTILANTVYTISYHTTSPYIAYTGGGLSSAISNGPLHLLADSGVYRYGASGFPTLMNGQAPNYWVDVLFNAGTTAPPPNVLGNNAPDPSLQNVFDSNITSNGGVEVGELFVSDVAGSVLGIRFYKGSQDTGTQTGELWASSGDMLLASATFTNETASGWQTVMFSTPVSINAGAAYFISYHTTSPYLSYTPGGLSSEISNGPLHLLGNSSVYKYGSSGFPTLTNGQDPNYWVDVIFQ